MTRYIEISAMKVLTAFMVFLKDVPKRQKNCKLYQELEKFEKRLSDLLHADLSYSTKQFIKRMDRALGRK